MLDSKDIIHLAFSAMYISLKIFFSFTFHLFFLSRINNACNGFLNKKNQIFSKSTTTDYFPYVTVSPNSVSTTDKYVTSASSVTGHVYNALNPSPTKTSLSDHIPRVTTKYSSSTKGQFIPTMAPVNEIVTTVTPTTSYIHFSRHPSTEASSTLRASSHSTLQSSLQNGNIVSQEKDYERTTVLPSTKILSESLATLLRREGLFAMAKYLRQSGLDNVLNETGESVVKYACDNLANVKNYFFYNM